MIYHKGSLRMGHVRAHKFIYYAGQIRLLWQSLIFKLNLQFKIFVGNITVAKSVLCSNHKQ